MFIMQCLTYAPSKRVSSSEAYKHPWLSKEVPAQLNLKESKEYLSNMMSFKKSVKIQKAFSIFIVKQMQEKSDFAELKSLFKSIDKNGDGKLSRDELISGTTII